MNKWEKCFRLAHSFNLISEVSELGKDEMVNVPCFLLKENISSIEYNEMSSGMKLSIKKELRDIINQIFEECEMNLMVVDYSEGNELDNPLLK